MYKQVIELDVVIFRENEHYLVSCLQHYIVAQGDTVEDAKKAFEQTYLGQLAIAPFQEIGPAPKEYWQLPKTKLFISVESTFGWEQ